MNKYFEPKKEDLRLGYEYEEFLSAWDKWESRKINELCNDRDGMGGFAQVEFLIDCYPEYIRVKFLTKEQIEAEGWNFIKTEKDDFTILYEFIKPVSWFNVILVYYPNSNHLILSRKIEFELNDKIYSNVEHIFNGTIKSINEFRTLCKWLNIC